MVALDPVPLDERTAIGEVRNSIFLRTPAELTREQIVTAVTSLQKSKLDAHKKVYELLKTKKLIPPKVPGFLAMQKLRAEDCIFNEQGVEAEDIGPSVRRLGLENEEELKALQDGCMQQINDFLSEKNDEVSKMMQKVLSQTPPATNPEEAAAATEALQDD